jgi:hypothetical protein
VPVCFEVESTCLAV